MDIDAARRATDWLHDAFFVALVEASRVIGVAAANLLLVLRMESDLRPWAAHRNESGYPTAVGLNQITAVRARAMGLSEADRLAILELSAEAQMPLVARSFRSSWRGAIPDAVAAYVVNFAPAWTSRSGEPDFELYANQPAIVRANAILDADKDGRITMRDLERVLRAKAETTTYLAALERLRALPGQSGAVPTFPSSQTQAPGAVAGARAYATAGTLLGLAAAGVAIGASAVYLATR